MKRAIVTFNGVRICLLCLFSVFVITGCTNNNGIDDWYDDYQGMQGGGQGGGTSTKDANIGGLTDFDVAFNTTALTETESVPAGDADYVENASFDGTITIKYSGTSASVSGDADGVTTVNGADVTVAAGSKKYDVVLTGTTTDGSLTIASDTQVGIHLNGVTMENKDGAVINIASKKSTAYIVSVNGTENTLTDGGRQGVEGSGTTLDPKVKGVIFSKGKAVFSGKGMLTVNGKYKNGIDTKKSLVIRPNTDIYVTLTDTIQKGSCIKCENTDAGNGMYIRGGVLNLSNPTVAGKGLSSDGELTVSGGRTTAICTGNGVWDSDETDVSGSAGIKCDSTFTLTGGELWLKSTGKGGKGINGDSNLDFAAGTVHVITTGTKHTYTYSNYTYDTSPKGIKTDGNINVTGGEIYARATGTTDGSEGIEAKQAYNQSGGTVMVYAADDALNTGYSSETLQQKIQMGLVPSGTQSNQGHVYISGGTLYCYSMSNDGMDSNGYININGGTVISFGAGAPETSIDCDNDSHFSVTGGTIFGIGGASPNTPGASCTQCYAVTSFSPSQNTTCTVKASDGMEIVSVLVPRAYSGGALVVSSPKMAKGTTYTIASSSSSTSTFTTSSSSWITSSYSGSMGGNAGGNGGMGGNGGGGRPGGF